MKHETEEPALIPEPKLKWLPRIVKKMDEDPSKKRIIVELVYGSEQLIKTRDVERLEVVGTAYHQLHGPTAEASITALCEVYNQQGKLPPDKLPERARVDGWQQSRKTVILEALPMAFKPNIPQQ